MSEKVRHPAVSLAPNRSVTPQSCLRRTAVQGPGQVWGTRESLLPKLLRNLAVVPQALNDGCGLGCHSKLSPDRFEDTLVGVVQDHSMLRPYIGTTCSPTLV